MFIATLVADDLDREDRDVKLVRDRLAMIGGKPAGMRRIEAGRAVDVEFDGNLDRARASLNSLSFSSNGGKVDVIVQPAAGREKRMLIADMDSTMIQCECIDELADYAGVKPRVAAVTEAAMRGELDFVGALRARVALLAGLSEAVLQRCYDERVRLTPGARTLVRTMRARGGSATLVSGGFQFFAARVAAAIGFDRWVANALGADRGKLDGTVRGPIVDATTKREILDDAIRALGQGNRPTLAVGDGANDLPMIQAAGLGVAYHAKPVVAAAAAARIEHGDLTTLLYAQGIARADWVED